ncbi:hypothetical protein LSH36_928g00008 [Paralvinella palmiformis]|uniref:Uncharacterized protein n=1 Tax=Paralvinella palmiformis TaxID=53620 RepID=A0AAD9IYY7_9ANNE|nr:hypothetical protein LSH36_928g00008 [Paralvinella palmiformis]
MLVVRGTYEYLKAGPRSEDLIVYINIIELNSGQNLLFHRLNSYLIQT